MGTSFKVMNPAPKATDIKEESKLKITEVTKQLEEIIIENDGLKLNIKKQNKEIEKMAVK